MSTLDTFTSRSLGTEHAPKNNAHTIKYKIFLITFKYLYLSPASKKNVYQNKEGARLLTYVTNRFWTTRVKHKKTAHALGSICVYTYISNPKEEHLFLIPLTRLNCPDSLVRNKLNAFQIIQVPN